MIPSAFEYHAPTSLPDAIALLGKYGEEAKLLAGGHSQLPMMKLRFAAPGHLIDLGRIPDLRGISEAGNEIHIGAMTTENELVWSNLLRLYEREAALAWLFGINPTLGDRRPIDLIRLGRTEELMRAIRAERSDAFQ